LGKCRVGTSVKINQCPNCGGVWCDSDQFYRVDPDNAEELIEFDQDKFNHQRPAHNELSCPGCSSELKAINDRLIPDDLDLEKCSNCRGVWAKAGTFLRYKKWRKKKLDSRKTNKEQSDPKFGSEEVPPQVRSFLNEQYKSNQKSRSRVRGVTSLLNTRISPAIFYLGPSAFPELRKNPHYLIIIAVLGAMIYFARNFILMLLH